MEVEEKMKRTFYAQYTLSIIQFSRQLIMWDLYAVAPPNLLTVGPILVIFYIGCFCLSTPLVSHESIQNLHSQIEDLEEITD
jgi:hypothetical protein